MTRPILLFLLSGLLLVVSAAPVFSGSAQEPASQEPAGGAEEEHTVIEDQMKVIKGNMRKLRRGLRDAEQLPAALPIVAEMQAAAQIAKMEAPKMAMGIADEAERMAFTTAYRQGMIATQRLMLDLEEAILAGDLEACTAKYNALKDAQDQGHDKFTDE